MLKKITARAAFVAFVFFNLPVHAVYTQGTDGVAVGADASTAAVGQLLISPPLPDLDGGSFTLTPMVGQITVNADNSNAAQMDQLNPGFKIRYSGRAKGKSAGLGITIPTSTDFGFFIFGVGSKISGEFQQTLFENQINEKENSVKATGLAVVTGVQYRLIGTSESIFAMGLFAGPGFYSMRSSMVYENVSMNTKSKVSYNPSGFGVIAGMQFMLRIGGLRINPYFMGFGDTGDNFKKISIEATATISEADYKCGGHEGHYRSAMGVAGTGLNVGYHSFRINVGTNSMTSAAKFKAQATTVSLGISF
jgi:hypothetical protein